MMAPIIRMTYLYPDSFNLHGDRGNMMAFERITGMMGAKFEYEKIDSFDSPLSFDKTDILFVSPGELRTCEGIAKLLRDRRDPFAQYLNRGGTMVVIGTSIALFAKETKRLDGTVFEGLRLVESTCSERNITYSNDEVYACERFGEPMQIVGGQIQMIDVLRNGEEALGRVSYGYGNCHGEDEGIVKDRLYFTNALGPVFVKNPRFAAALLRDILEDKTGARLALPEFALEEKSNAQIMEFIELKIRKYDKSRLEA
ncbi:MAG: hypothetical protein ACC608_04115 [Anaerofustis sp.]